jgi:phage tail-like protein
MNISKTMWKWFEAVQSGKWGQQRRDGSLVIYNQGAEETVRYNFRRAWPSSYKIKDLNASANEFQIEELELVLEEFVRV